MLDLSNQDLQTLLTFYFIFSVANLPNHRFGKNGKQSFKFINFWNCWEIFEKQIDIQKNVGNTDLTSFTKTFCKEHLRTGEQGDH